MIEETFSELVNLYLDKEISTADLQLLKAELARDPERKAEFQERCRLHQAMRLALGASRENGRRSSRRSGSTSSSKRRRSSSEQRERSSLEGIKRGRRVAPNAARRSDLSVRRPVSHFPRWILGTGLAACLTIGGMMLFPVFTDTTHITKQSLEGVEEDELANLDEQDPLDLINRSDLRRIASAHQRPERRSASLAAEMRLMGLSPEVVVADEAELLEVSLASTQPRDTRLRRIEMLNQLKDYSPIPDLNILHSSDSSSSRSSWPSGFQTSLASFK